MATPLAFYEWSRAGNVYTPPTAACVQCLQNNRQCPNCAFSLAIKRLSPEEFDAFIGELLHSFEERVNECLACRAIEHLSEVSRFGSDMRFLFRVLRNEPVSAAYSVWAAQVAEKIRGTGGRHPV